MSDKFETSSSSSSSSSSSDNDGGFEASSAENTPQAKISNKSSSQKEQKIQEALASVLASGSWKAVKDPKGRTYYYNTLTLQTTWDLVKELNLDQEVDDDNAKNRKHSKVGARTSSSTSSEEDDETVLRRMKQWSGNASPNTNNNNINNAGGSTGSQSLSNTASRLQFRSSGAFGAFGENGEGGDDQNEQEQEEEEEEEEEEGEEREQQKPDDGMNDDKPSTFVAFGNMHVGGNHDDDDDDFEEASSTEDDRTPAKNDEKPKPAPKFSTNTDVSPFTNPESNSSQSSSRSSSPSAVPQEVKQNEATNKTAATIPTNRKEVSQSRTSSSGFSEAPPEIDHEAIAATEIGKQKLEQERRDEQERARERENIAEKKGKEQNNEEQQQMASNVQTRPAFADFKPTSESAQEQTQVSNSTPASSTPAANTMTFSNLGAALLAIGRGKPVEASNLIINNNTSIGATTIHGTQSNPLQRPSAEQLISVNNSVTNQLISQSRQNLLLPSQQYELAQQEALDLRTKSEALRNLAEAYTALVTRRVTVASTIKNNNKSSQASPMDVLLHERKRQKAEEEQKQQIVDALRTVLTQKQLGMYDDEEDNDDGIEGGFERDSNLLADQAQKREERMRQRLRNQLYQSSDANSSSSSAANRVVYKEISKKESLTQEDPSSRGRPVRLASRLLVGGDFTDEGENEKMFAATNEELSNDAILDLVVQMAVAELPKKKQKRRTSSHSDPNRVDQKQQKCNNNNNNNNDDDDDDDDDNIVISKDGFVRSKSIKATSSLPTAFSSSFSLFEDSTIPNPTQCVQEMFKDNLNRHIINPLKRHIRSLGSTSKTPSLGATPHEVASVQRFILSSVARVIGELLRQVLNDERSNLQQQQQDRESSLTLPSATYFIKYSGPSADQSIDGKRLRHMVYRTLHCLPFEVHPVAPLTSSPASSSTTTMKQQPITYEPASFLIRNKIELVEASKKSDFFRLEAWVTSSHLLDASSCVLEAITSIEHFMADGYQPFNFVASAAAPSSVKTTKKSTTTTTTATNSSSSTDNDDLLFGLVLLPETPILQLYRRTDREFVPAHLATRSSHNSRAPLSDNKTETNTTNNKENITISRNGAAVKNEHHHSATKVSFDATAARLHLKDQESIEMMAFLASSLTQELEAETAVLESDQDDTEVHKNAKNDTEADDFEDPKSTYEKLLQKQKANKIKNKLSPNELRRMRESIVTSTLEDLLDDDKIRSAVLRKCKSKFDKMMEEHKQDPNARRRQSMEVKMDQMVEQMKKEVMDENRF